jgi:ABC-type lipoprotein export system ATPase subunit
VSPEPAVLVERVSKRYDVQSGVVEALHDVDATIARAAVTALVGVSGSGKSTLLRLVAGLEAPTGGRIVAGGVDLGGANAAAVRDFRRRHVSFVAQRAADNLFPHLTVAEQLPSGADPWLERLGIAHRRAARASQLSGGELARASLAVALARDTPMLVVDEPTAELDRESARALLDALATAARQGTTVVVATHDPDVLEVSDHVIELARGRNAGPAARPPAPAARDGGEPVVRAEHLSKAYGQMLALDDVSLELRRGELVVAVGRSGSGKSTLLMVLGGWQRADRGRVDIPGGRAWQALGYVPQRFGLVPELNVEENVGLPGRLIHDTVAVHELLERLGLDGLEQRAVTELSIGQQQRVAVARAIALRPAVLLVDEPTSHQDVASAERVWSALAAAAEDGSACLVATHEPDARLRAHRSWSIDGGRIVS